MAPRSRADRAVLCRDAFAHHRDLRAAHGFRQRVKLAVDVRHADFVQIHQRDRTHAGAGQRLGRPNAHAADANDANVRGAEFLQSALSVKPRDAAKPCFKIAH